MNKIIMMLLAIGLIIGAMSNTAYSVESGVQPAPLTEPAVDIEKKPSLIHRIVETIKGKLSKPPCLGDSCVFAKGDFSNQYDDYKIFALGDHPTYSPTYSGMPERTEVYLQGPYPENLLEKGLQLYCRIVNIPDPSKPSDGNIVTPQQDRSAWALHRMSGCIPTKNKADPTKHDFLCSFRSTRGVVENLIEPGTNNRIQCLVSENHVEFAYEPYAPAPRVTFLSDDDATALLDGDHSPVLTINDLDRNDEMDIEFCTIDLGCPIDYPL